MNEPAHDYRTTDQATTEGLEDLFADATQCEAGGLQCEAVATHCEYTIAQATQALKVSPSTIYRRIKSGKYKTLIDSEGVLKVLMRRIAMQPEMVESHFKTDATQCDALDLQCEAVPTHQNDLAKALVEMSYKLQHATYRNGWLESKLEEFQKDIEQRDQQIKLLTDSQHKSSRWARFKKWFFGR